MVVLENAKGIGRIMDEVVAELQKAGPYKIAITTINPHQHARNRGWTLVEQPRGTGILLHHDSSEVSFGSLFRFGRSLRTYVWTYENGTFIAQAGAWVHDVRS